MLFQHFHWDLTIRYFFFIFCPAITWTWEISLEDAHSLVQIFCRLYAKVSLMLDNRFPFPSRCKLNHISVCFIQISTRITYKRLIQFRKSHFFFKVISGVLGGSVNFNKIQRFVLRRPVFLDCLSVSYDYGYSNAIANIKPYLNKHMFLNKRVFFLVSVQL